MTEEELRQRMEKRLRSIPSPNLREIKKDKVKTKNREQDYQNYQNTMKILEERHKEAEIEGNHKKKFAANAYSHDQRDKFNVRNQLSKLQDKFGFVKNTIPEEEWLILEPLIEFNDEVCIDGDFSEKDLHQYFRDEFDIKPKYIVKLIELIKIKNKIDQTKIDYGFKN